MHEVKGLSLILCARIKSTQISLQKKLNFAVFVFLVGGRLLDRRATGGHQSIFHTPDTEQHYYLLD